MAGWSCSDFSRSTTATESRGGLLGAAARIRDEVGYRRLPIHEAPYDAAVAAARGGSGGAFGWFEEGRRLDRQEAIEYARRGRDAAETGAAAGEGQA